MSFSKQIARVGVFVLYEKWFDLFFLIPRNRILIYEEHALAYYWVSYIWFAVNDKYDILCLLCKMRIL